MRPSSVFTRATFNTRFDKLIDGFDLGDVTLTSDGGNHAYQQVINDASVRGRVFVFTTKGRLKGLAVAGQRDWLVLTDNGNLVAGPHYSKTFSFGRYRFQEEIVKTLLTGDSMTSVLNMLDCEVPFMATA